VAIRVQNRCGVGWMYGEEEDGSVGQRVGRRNNQKRGGCDDVKSSSPTIWSCWSTSIRQLFLFWLRIFSCVSLNVTCIRTLQLMVVWWISYGMCTAGVSDTSNRFVP
jgi:hypothetical protein